MQTINYLLVDKLRHAHRQLLAQIEDVRSHMVAHQTFDDSQSDTSILDRFLPHYAARAMWIRSLVERINQDYARLSDSSSRADAVETNELKSSYEKVVALADHVEKRIYQEWWTTATDLQPRQLLQKPFLKEHPTSKYRIDVYFDPQIIVALSESLWWMRLKYDIPYSLTDVYNTRKSFRQMREETTGFIRRFNK